MFIRIGGVSGVGKTTIINAIVAASSKLNLPITRVKGSDYLLKILNVSSCEKLREIPEEVRAEARREMFERMYQDDREDPKTIRLRDAHYTLWQEGSGFTDFPTQKGDKAQMLCMVCLCAPPDVILARREADARPDRCCDEKIIKEELEKEFNAATEQAKSLGCKLIRIENVGNVASACRQLVRETMGEFEFQKELLNELSAGTSDKERLH